MLPKTICPNVETLLPLIINYELTIIDCECTLCTVRYKDILFSVSISEYEIVSMTVLCNVKYSDNMNSLFSLVVNCDNLT